MEATAQIALWLAASLLCREQLLVAVDPDRRRAMGHLPLLGWTVVGHNWSLYLTYMEGLTDNSDRVVVRRRLYFLLHTLLSLWLRSYADSIYLKRVLEPIDGLVMHTRSIYHIFKLGELIRRIKWWESESYWSTLQSDLRVSLEPYADKFVRIHPLNRCVWKAMGWN